VEENKNSLKKELISWIMIFVVAIAAAYVINSYLIVNATIPSGSMIDTIDVGDRVIGNRFAYVTEDPKRGDIVIFKFPDDESKYYIKRIIGLPGETIRITKGKIYIDDKEFNDKYATDAVWGQDEEDMVFTVPNNCYFMLGDNRDNSADSRYWVNPYVKKSKILGKAVFRYWPFTKLGTLD